MENLTGLIGSISGVISIIILIYMLGYWKGKVDQHLKSFERCLQDYPPAELATMVKTLWEVYVVDALHHRPDLATHSSFHLKQEGHDLIPERIKPALDAIPPSEYNSNAIASGYLVVKYLGIEIIQGVAREGALSVHETIAILSCYLNEKAESLEPHQG